MEESVPPYQICDGRPPPPTPLPPPYMIILFPIPKSIDKKKSTGYEDPSRGMEVRRKEATAWSNGHPYPHRNQGGLGIKNLSIQNDCLLQKWLWRFCTEDMVLWRRFIVEKYGLINQWSTEEAMGTFGCCVWKAIRRLWPQFYSNFPLK